MSNPLERIPETWDDDLDSAFFTITARLFSAELIYGAGVLLSAGETEPLATTHDRRLVG